MRFAPRVAVAALVTTTAAAAALLSFSVPALATPVPPAPNPSLIRTWTNTNPATDNVVDIVISRHGNGITVDGFGACSPAPCEWGAIQGTVFGTSVSSVTGNSFEANWNFGFAREVLLGTLNLREKPATLTVQEFTTFTDHSGRANFTVTETFRPGRRIVPTQTGTRAANYPLGDSVHPVNALLGVWVNISPTTAGIRKIVLTRVAGRLYVSAYGNCSPTLCVWGKIRGITFGTSITSVSGRAFLAPYVFGFAKKLVDGAINAKGTLLTVQTYTEFTDHSGRSNYLYVDTFRRG